MAILGPFLGGRQKPRTYPNSRGPNWLSRHGPALGRWFWVEFRSGYIWHGGSLSPAAAARGGGGHWARSTTRTVRPPQVLGRPLYIAMLGLPRLACRPAPSTLTRKGPRGLRAGADSEHQ